MYAYVPYLLAVRYLLDGRRTNFSLSKIPAAFLTLEGRDFVNNLVEIILLKGDQQIRHKTFS